MTLFPYLFFLSTFISIYFNTTASLLRALSHSLPVSIFVNSITLFSAYLF